MGPAELASTMPYHASQMYSRNIVALLNNMLKDGALNLDLEDEVTKGCLVTHGGEVVHERAKATLSAS
jgi:NAD(P) transhydrogenase subunit alpha